MKITKGKKYLCIKDVESPTGSICYHKGKIYKSDKSFCITNENGSTGHCWIEENSALEYFQPLSEAKWAVKRTPENADELDKWSGQKWNGEIDIWVTSSKKWSNRLPIDHTEISFDTFKEIVEIEEEKKTFEVGDWVVGCHNITTKKEYHKKAWVIGKIEDGYAYVKGSEHNTGIGNIRIATKEEIAEAQQPTEEWQPKNRTFTYEDMKRCYNGVLQNVGTCVKKEDLPTFEQYIDSICKIEIPMSEALEIIAQAKGINVNQIKIV